MAKLQPIPPNPIEECFVWREWLQKLGDFTNTTVTTVVNLTTGSANASSNTITLQNALNLGGDIRIISPGTYEFSSVMTVPSNTSIYIGAGVTLKVTAGAPSALFTNSYARSTGYTVTAANAAYTTAPDGVNFCISLTNLAGVGSNFPVGSYISAVVTGHGVGGSQSSAFSNRGYRGVYRVVESSANALKYQIYQLYPGGAPPSLDFQIFNANENIKIYGPGSIDGNGANCATTLAGVNLSDGNPAGNVIWWRHAYNVTIDGPKFYRGITWTVGSNYVRDYTVRATCELRVTNPHPSTDFIHLSGHHQNVLIENCSGGAGDNFVGMTIDCTDLAASPGGNAYNFAYQSPGDMYDIKIRNVNGDCYSALGAFGVIGIYGPAAYRYQNIRVEGVIGAGSSVIQLANYSITNQTQLNIDELYINNSRANAGSSQVYIDSGNYNINTISMERISTIRPDTGVLTIVSGATGTLRSLYVNTIQFSPYDNSTFTRAANMITLGGINIATAFFSNMEDMILSAGNYLIQRVGAGTISKLVMQDISATGPVGTAAVYINSGGGAAPTPVYLRCSYNGAAL